MFIRRSLSNAMPLVAGMAVAACGSDSTGPAEAAGQRVTLSVATTGEGMSPPSVPRMRKGLPPIERRT